MPKPPHHAAVVKVGVVAIVIISIGMTIIIVGEITAMIMITIYTYNAGVDFTSIAHLT